MAPSMKCQTFKYPGDAAFQKLLEKYNCPTPFHVVRMRFRSKVLTQIHAIVDARLFSGRPWLADREACDSGAHQSLRASWNAGSVSGGLSNQAGLRRAPEPVIWILWDCFGAWSGHLTDITRERTGHMPTDRPGPEGYTENKGFPYPWK